MKFDKPFWWRWQARFHKVKMWFVNRSPKTIVWRWVQNANHDWFRYASENAIREHIATVQACDFSVPKEGGYHIVICRLQGHEIVKVTPIMPNEDPRTARDLIYHAEHILLARHKFYDCNPMMRRYMP